MKKKIAFLALSIFMGLCFMMGPTYASTLGSTVNNNYGENTEQTARELQEDVTTDLLTDTNGESLTSTEYDGFAYDLESISITRHRQKVKVEYYVGDYNTSQLIGSDEGYADYYAPISYYLMNVATLNATFAQAIPTSHKLVTYVDGASFGKVPAYSGSETTHVVKVLVTEVKHYTISVSHYQNRQDIQNPNPIGQTRDQINALSEYWRVGTMSTSVNAIVGQTVNIKNAGRINDTLEKNGRVGTLTNYGVYQDSDTVFAPETSIVISATQPTAINLAAFYEVDDFGSPVVNPGHAGSTTSGAGIGFTGTNVTWKAPTETETLLLANKGNALKLSAYPFNIDDDPFDAKDPDIYGFAPSNWILGHKLVIDYNYAKGAQLIPTPEPEPVVPTTPIPTTPKEPGIVDPKESIAPPKVDTSKSVATSDSTNLSLLTFVMIASIVSIVGIQYKKKAK